MKKNMVFIPGSIFSMGCRKKKKINSSARSVEVKPFYIDKYPVTNIEYGKVIANWKYDPAKKNHPVAGLPYEKILEYCRLTDKRLPLEEEWEKAARGDKDERLYPWGNNFSTKRCNCRKFYFMIRGATSCVDKFPSGQSLYGCYDMIGNVWEWTGSKDENGKYILKGGSCNSPSRIYLTIASRLYALSSTVNQDFGFRCCLTA